MILPWGKLAGQTSQDLGLLGMSFSLCRMNSVSCMARVCGQSELQCMQYPVIGRTSSGIPGDHMCLASLTAKSLLDLELLCHLLTSLAEG